MYYILKERTDKEVGNIFPQVSCLSQYDAHELHSDECPERPPELIFELRKAAKLTDVLSQACISANGLLVSEKLKKILENFILIKHKFYPATVFYKRERLKYYWLHLCNDYSILNLINYPLSKFYRTEYGFREEDLPLLNSYDDYVKYDKLFGIMSTIDSDFIFFNSNVDYQMFTIPLFDMNIYIDEKICNKLIEEKITGIQCIEATTINL